MADPDIPKYADFLKQLYFFRDLDQANLAHLVSRLLRMEPNRDDLILQEGEVDNDFYLIYQGKVQLSQQVQGVDISVGNLGPGDYFGEEASLLNQPSAFSVRVVSRQAILLRLRKVYFDELLQEYPQLGVDLKDTLESRRRALEKKFDWIGQDEVVYMLTQKHWFMLLVTMLLPAAIAFFGLLSLAYGLARPDNIFGNLPVIFGILGILFAGLLVIWLYVDWKNDFYILTNQRVVWLERVVFLYYSRREAPLPHILAVNVFHGWLGRIFGYGNVEVRTFTGSILMRNSANPYRLATFIEGFIVRAKELDKQYEAENMEKALQDRLKIVEGEEPSPSEPPPATTVATKAERSKGVRAILDTFFKVRFVDGAVITYRKHWLVLVRKSWLPLFLLFLYTILAVILVQSGILAGTCFPSLLVLGYIGLFLWLIYRYVDWNNDIYQLTPDQILDIERRPLGEERKKSAPLDSILSLEHTREGVIRLIFNYGDVIINVGQTQFLFYGVKNPDEVQQDIVSYIEARRRKKQDEVTARERERMLDWFSTYHSQSEKLEEVEKKSDWDLFPG
jgi:uncharacterized membrane protein YdbT with pleckstrin-like domain